MKESACNDVGIEYRDVNIADDESLRQEDIIDQIKIMAGDPTVSGIIVQLPLPEHINSQTVLSHIPSEKDVDGIGPYNIGALGLKLHHPKFVSCTPMACLELIILGLMKKHGTVIKKFDLECVRSYLQGRRVTIIGRSNIVGMPLFLLLNRFDCQV